MELTAALSADDRLASVDADCVVGGLYRLGDEVVRVKGQNRPVGSAVRLWSIDRGREGTTPASHADGVTVLPLVDVVGDSAFSEGGPGGSSFPLTADVSADGHTISDLADPVADGDAASKGYVDANAGGVASSQRELFSGSNEAVLGNASNHDMSWTKAGGADLLDLTDPKAPVVIATGDYAINLSFNAQATPAGSEHTLYWVALDADINGDDAFQDSFAMWTDSAVDPNVDTNQASLSLTYHLPAGAVLEAAVRQRTGSSVNFNLQGSIRRLA